MAEFSNTRTRIASWLLIYLIAVQPLHPAIAAGIQVERTSFHVDGAYCNFPDMNSCYEEEHFDGVEFAYGYPPEEDDTITVSEEVCFNYVRLACEKYLQLHPEDTDKVRILLTQLP
ncbi:TPA: ribonuclease toxin immunity protein CdiI [Yersinia enterocolitica]